MLLNVAVGLLIVGALFGVVILTAILSRKPTPKFAVVMHGLLVVSGVVSAVVYAFDGHRSPLIIAGLTLLILAAFGGTMLLRCDLSQKPLPKAFALGHPVLALFGIVLLIACFFQ